MFNNLETSDILKVEKIAKPSATASCEDEP